MAFTDYYICDLCGNQKTFYDASLWSNVGGDPYEGRVGSMKVICKDCAKTHEVTIAPISPTPTPSTDRPIGPDTVEAVASKVYQARMDYRADLDGDFDQYITRVAIAAYEARRK